MVEGLGVKGCAESRWVVSDNECCRFKPRGG